MKIYYFKLSLFLFIIFHFLISTGQAGDNGNKTNEIDITNWNWEIEYLTSNNKTLSPQKNDYFVTNAYILEFTNDSSFLLNTSINSAGGGYKIIQFGVISISNYHEFTAVGTIDNYDREVNDSLLSIFNKVTAYQVTGDTLIFKGTNSEVVAGKLSTGIDKSYGWMQSFASDNLKLYPLPAYDELFIAYKNQSLINKPFTIYNASGNEILSGKINYEQSINISALHPGFYIIKIGNTDCLKQKFLIR